MIRIIAGVIVVYAIAIAAWLMSLRKPVSEKEKELQDEQIHSGVLDVEEKIAAQRKANDERRKRLGLSVFE